MRMHSLFKSIGVTTAIASALSGCATDDPSIGRPVVESEQALNLVAQLESENGSQLNFYEPEPGHVLLLETGLVGERPLINAELAQLTAVEKFERLSGRAAPIALIEAQQRVERYALEGGETLGFVPQVEEVETAPIAAAIEDSRATAEVGVSSQAITTSEFVDIYCDPPSNYDREAFWTNGSGPSDFTWTQLNYVSSAALSLRGDIRFRARWRPRASWSGYTTVWLPKGYFSSFYEDGRAILGFGWNSIVDNADGDLYHFCSYADKNL